MQRAALAGSLVVVFGATLSPGAGPNHVALAPWAAQQLDPVNIVGNIVLFALPSAVLWFYGWSLHRVVVAGSVLSLESSYCGSLFPAGLLRPPTCSVAPSVRRPAGC